MSDVALTLFFLRSVSSQLHIHACVMLESLCQVVENCLCKRYVPLGPGMLGVLVQACIAHMCLAKKFCFDLGVLGENALTNSISCCYVCV